MKPTRRRHLPSIGVLATFEPVARCPSFTLAARALTIIQSAVSQQIRLLEQALAVPLFRRLHNTLELIGKGVALPGSVARGLDAISAGVGRVKKDHESGQVTVLVLKVPGLFRGRQGQGGDHGIRPLSRDDPKTPGRAPLTAALGPGFPYQGILGTVSTGRLVEEAQIFDRRAVVPTIRVSGWVFGINTLAPGHEDRVPMGNTTRDVWS